jgi:hypothetical protein
LKNPGMGICTTEQEMAHVVATTGIFLNRNEKVTLSSCLFIRMSRKESKGVSIAIRMGTYYMNKFRNILRILQHLDLAYLLWQQ